jgi:hypothetical protein
MSQVRFTTINGFDVSTVSIDAMGMSKLSPFTMADYADETPWPFETMIFKCGSSTGIYHKPHATKEEAIADHEKVVQRLKDGEQVSGGVRGVWGTPSTTPEEWLASIRAPQSAPGSAVRRDPLPARVSSSPKAR